VAAEVSKELRPPSSESLSPKLASTSGVALPATLVSVTTIPARDPTDNISNRTIKEDTSNSDKLQQTIKIYINPLIIT
jgi:hypothetical protein